MHTVISLDYELYFGANAGTVQRCLIQPTDALMARARERRFHLVFFVDAGMLFRMGRQAVGAPEVGADLASVRQQLRRMVSEGHDVQFHVHPHWEDSSWADGRWHMNTHRYRLHAFSESDVQDIVRRYRDALAEASGYADICAYRAGGWALQPFDKISDALQSNGIVVDSTVMPGHFDADEKFGYDFRKAPSDGLWRFDADPNVATPAGRFLEIPISRVASPVTVKLGSAFSKRLGLKRHAIFGDGFAVGADSPSRSAVRMRRLLHAGPIPVTVDGYRAKLLVRAYKEHAARSCSAFVVIGHPKAITPYALDCLDSFVDQCKPQTVTYPQLRDTHLPTQRLRA